MKEFKQTWIQGLGIKDIKVKNNGLNVRLNPGYVIKLHKTKIEKNLKVYIRHENKSQTVYIVYTDKLMIISEQLFKENKLNACVLYKIQINNWVKDYIVTDMRGRELLRNVGSYKPIKSIDKVTTTNLELALRLCDISLNREIVDRIIDVVELLEEKGDELSIKDIDELKQKWNECHF